MTNKAIYHDPDYWERIGFRSAWISLTQVPLVYLLSSKASVLGFLVGSSYDHLNWLHRWVSRTLLVSVTVHGAFFMDEWYRADFVVLEMQMLPMVKYGLGAWAILVWTLLTSFSPIRRFAYEFFVLQHIASAGVFLWLVWIHVPKYSKYYVYFAVAAASFDWLFRGLLLVYQNIRYKKLGFRAQLQAFGDDVTILKLEDVPISWKAGQHLRIWIPRLGFLETHPFTIACRATATHKQPKNDIQFAIRTRSGITKRINRYAQKYQKGTENSSLSVFISGPYGSLPNWKAYETVVLISASTGASFTVPILETLLDRTDTTCVRRIAFLVLTRSRSHIEYYIKRLSDAVAHSKDSGIELTIKICITGDGIGNKGDIIEAEEVVAEKNAVPDDNISIEELNDPPKHSYVALRQMTHSASSSITDGDIGSSSGVKTGYIPIEISEADVIPVQPIVYSPIRPNIADFIRGPVESAAGETTIAVCGGKSLVSTVRNCVVRLSDERAVHKGTGAQGIHMYSEEYCF
jgi:NAD(P)H-flavin reductase